MKTTLHIKPNKNAYLGIGILKIFSFIAFAVLAILFLLSIYYVGSSESCPGPECADSTLFAFCPSIIGIFTIAFSIFSFLNLFISYNKEEYIIEEQRIIIKKGGIFYDSSTELKIRNITFLDLELPFIENSIFKTGKITITSAGTGLLSSLTLLSLATPETIFQAIEEAMKANGFKLERKTLVMEAQPDTIGILLNILRKTGGLASFLFFAYFFINIFLISASSSLIWPMITFIVFVILYLAAVIIRFLDLKQRRYKVYEDCVHYNKGFLTKHSAFIPVENLSDSNTTQTFMQKIFGVYDIEISSKGIASEIKFKNLTQGEQIEAAIDNIAIKHQKELHAKPAQTESVSNSPINLDEKQWHTTDFTSELKMNPVVALLQFFISLIASSFIVIIIIFTSASSGEEVLANVLFYGFFLVIGYIFGTISKILQIFYTKYKVADNSIKEQYKFLSTKNKEFNVQKITAVIMLQSLLDRIFNTCSIKFISIGSSSDITFEHINRDEQFLEQLALKFGFDTKDTPQQEIKAHFSITKMLLKELAGYLVLGFLLTLALIALLILSPYFSDLDITSILPYFALIIGVIFLLFFIRALYGHFYHKQTRLKLYSDKLVLEQGLINLSRTLARYDNIKDLKATKWPLTQSGTLQINIAGDQIPQNNKNNSQTNTDSTSIKAFSNKLVVDYLDTVHQQLNELEEYFQGKKTTPADVAVSKPALANDLFLLFLLSLLIWPLILLIPFSLIELIKRRYIVQEHRVMERRGILNISITSILFEKIDNINRTQGPVNKLFGNGSITLETAGSLSPELILSNVKDYSHLYELIREKYSQIHKSGN
ncbi:MAG TPA: PH domain-containing protein [Candidatus Dojkabacteria bacterium]|nr:PH domain-containing protein [Candidatus Dojkabacteria bacterium]